LHGRKERETVVRDGIEVLREFENEALGGYSFFRERREIFPFLTVHVAHAHAVAKEKGFRVESDTWRRNIKYLRDIDQNIPRWYSASCRWAIRSYAVYVLEKMGIASTQTAASILDEAGIENLPIEALGWLLSVFGKAGHADHVRAISRRLFNSVAETAAGAHFVTDYEDGAYVLLHSDRRADGVLLDALLTAAPKSDLVPKLVRGLLAHRVKGRWSSTQENAFVLLALDRYFRKFEKVTPNFVARAWLGNRLALEYDFEERTTERAGVEIPIRHLSGKKTAQPVVIQKVGDGRLYYRLGMRYAPTTLSLEPVDLGFAVRREYEAVDDSNDVKRDADGTWRFKAGARVRVNITMAAPMRRYHVALVDAIPAGVESVNPTFVNTGAIPQDPTGKGTSRYWWWNMPWFAHQNLKDTRTEAFTPLLWPGVHDYSYVVRATTPGRYVVPPARAEEMYHPETFGRTGTDTVVIE
jgi:uncharacterized protein YfaS (alpha-2-macroglobulin family)